MTCVAVLGAMSRPRTTSVMPDVGIVDHDRELIRDRAVAPAHDRIAHVERRRLREIDPAVVDELDAIVVEPRAQRPLDVAPAARRQRPAAARVVVGPAAVGRAPAARAIARLHVHGYSRPAAASRSSAASCAAAARALHDDLVPVEAELGAARSSICSLHSALHARRDRDPRAAGSTRPPRERASSHTSSADSSVPGCASPVVDGANRPITTPT